MLTMPRALIAAALILVIGGGLAAFLVLPRYSLTNVGQGVSIRLDRMRGDMIGCEGTACRELVKGEKIAPVQWPGSPAAATR